MDTPKSHVEIYLGLASRLLGCDPLALCTPKVLRKDLEVLTSRTLTEGLSFLTKTLPKLGKALDKGMVDGRFSRPREFKRSHTSGSIPAFMQAYFKRVFGLQGELLADADPLAVKHLRQIMFFAYKLELPYRDDESDKVVESFVANEEALTHLELGEANRLLDAASYLVRDVLSGFDPKDIVPRHGPGAVATGEKLHDKWTFKRLYRGAHRLYPYYQYFVVGWDRELSDRLKWYKSLTRVESGCARVILVPKDSRGPRLISAEPLELQWLQQGISRKLSKHIESHNRTRGRVNFTNQEVNRDLALLGSITSQWVTLDLKDASDLVSLQLVRHIFQHVPETLAAFEAVRSAATVLPDGRQIQLLKHAPMGSALCFPVMALVCWAVIVAAVSRDTRSADRNVGRSVYVYGDDIIVPHEWAQISIAALESVGLRVNIQKSCIQGHFRESCGMDAFKGVVVSPIRVKKPWTGRRSDGTAYESYIQLSNNLLENGYYDACEFLRMRLRSVYGKIPYGTELAPYPCFLTKDVGLALLRNRKRFRRRFNADFQREEFLLPKVISRKMVTTLDDWPRLLRNMVTPPGDDPDEVVLPYSTKIKYGWTPVY